MIKIYLVIDAFGWVQEKRAKQFIELEKERNIIYKIIDFKYFKNHNDKFIYEKCIIYFMSWRILDGYDLTKLKKLKEKIIVGVTSHYNIGGVKNKSSCISNKQPYSITLKKSFSILNFFKYLSVNSEILHKYLKRKIKGKIFCTPNGVNHKYFIKKKINFCDQNKIKIGWNGKEKSAKNFKLLKKILKEYKFDIDFKFKVSNRKISIFDKLIFKKNNMKSFYSDLDFYLCTSWHEGTPNPCLESLSCGIPVITTKVGNMPEIIKNNYNGFFIEANIKSFGKTLKKIKKLNIIDYKKMSERARNSILKKWTWEYKYLAIKKMFIYVNNKK